jgi:hypothetical protein
MNRILALGEQATSAGNAAIGIAVPHHPRRSKILSLTEA